MTFKNLRRHAQIILSPKSTGQQFEAMKLFPILKNTVPCWLDDDAPTLGAARAYYTVFSLAPLSPCYSSRSEKFFSVFIFGQRA